MKEKVYRFRRRGRGKGEWLNIQRRQGNEYLGDMERFLERKKGEEGREIIKKTGKWVTT